MKVPYFVPLIDQPVINEMMDTLNGGWLTTGPKVKAFEKALEQLTKLDKVLCVNSWNAGTALMLNWFGLEPGDEVIIPAYTFSATAMCPLNLGAVVKMVDVGEDFNINVENIKKAITSKTKAILPVDMGGYPCDYKPLLELVNEPSIKKLFVPNSDNQAKLGRILILADAAHSIGATYNSKPAVKSTDVSVFSFQSVKNITTGEGGAVCLNLPAPFDNKEVYSYLKHFYLYGQTKTSADKIKGKWRYDVVSQGMKANMSDIAASIGLAQIRRYESELLPERRAIFEQYHEGFSKYPWAVVPLYQTANKSSSCHLYQMRFKGVTEAQRELLLQEMTNRGVGFGIHYIPMATLTFFKNKGYNIADYPVTYNNYASEISLPVHYGLKRNQIKYVIENVIASYEKVIANKLVTNLV